MKSISSLSDDNPSAEAMNTFLFLAGTMYSENSDGHSQRHDKHLSQAQKQYWDGIIFISTR